MYGSNLGSLLFHGNCTTCHVETKAISAPSIVQVKEKYLAAFPKKEDFISYMSTWVNNPNKETSIMLGAIKKYKLMPYLHYDMESLEEISAYIYETDFEKEN